jgi:prepilin-type N-terminal cleavage/methylation domain-containing protein
MKKDHAFTLIELLIVVAIIAILAAIAVPNFLEAQARAKVSSAKNGLRLIQTALMAYWVDWNYQLLRDSNDSDTPADHRGLDFTKETGQTPDVFVIAPLEFYTFRAFRPLTTPVAYITSVPIDPFSKIMPFAYDTREVNNKIHYSIVASMGPDAIAGHWLFGGSGGPSRGVPYDPSNGTKSVGDIWRILTVDEGEEMYRQEYGDFGNYW